MKQSLILIRKEAKSLSMRKQMTMIMLLTIMLTVLTIGKLGELELYLGLNEDGLYALLKALVQNEGYKEALRSVLLMNIIVYPSIIISFYIGFPYLLSFYHTNQRNGSLVYLMTMPQKMVQLVNGVTIFAYAKCAVAVCMIFFFAAAVLFLVTKQILISGQMIFITFILQVGMFSIYAMINSLIWIFNGSKVVVNGLRILMFLGIIFIMPMTKYVPFQYIKPGVWMIYVVIGSVILLLASMIAVRRFYNKEKLILNA